MNPFQTLMRGPGPVAWCNRCSRKHPRRACNLVLEEKRSKVRLNKDGTVRRGGNKVTCLVHPESLKLRKKSRARRS